MVQIENLCKSYGRFRALSNLNLSIKDGDIFGFVGPNGSGKTTTMRICAGLLQADSGRVYINGVDVLGAQDRIKDYFGYMPDFFGVYDNLKAIEYMEFFASAYGIYGKEARKLSLELMDLVNLSDKQECYVDVLSRGMKQRLCLARCLIHNPSLLMLDEPASGLDPRTRYELKEILKNLSQMGKTILISSHILTELAEMCTSIGIIEKGQTILQGSMEEILEHVNMQNPIIIKVSDDVNAAVRLLKEQITVSNISAQDNKIVITFKGSENQEVELLKTLVNNNVKVISFNREQGNLEDVFMELTGKGEV